ncbi:MAG: hypothetical protein IJX72_04080 [Clostridia bacterium]|nr:hypothetical protein [Clostridia bacterium]
MNAHTTDLLKQEMKQLPAGEFAPFLYRAQGYRMVEGAPVDIKRGMGLHTLFATPEAYLYRGDRIAGSIRPLWAVMSPEEKQTALDLCAPLGERGFLHNGDHFAPDYETFLREGIPGTLARIEASKASHANDPARVDFLESMKLAVTGLRDRIKAHATLAASLLGTEGYDNGALTAIRNNCAALCERAPETFAEALQLVWMVHTCFVWEGRYAMALGRIDQYLYPYFAHDMEAGTLTEEEATLLLENVFVKIYERHAYLGGDDVVNIAVAGVKPDGTDATNRLSFCVLRAVGNVNLPGPNLSARIAPTTPDEFLDECLKVIGTGLGYPALMNDEVNVAALSRYGYAIEDARNYSMVGCIENFITGMQPAWTDGRFDTPRFLEYVFNDGKGYFHPSVGIDTGSVASITSMDVLMERLETQIKAGVKEYVENFNRYNDLPNPENYTSPFLSVFCKDCIGRGLDINLGGAVYPSVHGAALMGVGTMCDSLAAIEQVIFTDKAATMEELSTALKANFEGYEPLRERLLAAPKYGNNDDLVDQYAVWFVDFLSDEFMKYKTRDGGGYYTAMAANVSNIYAGHTIGATPDGRRAGEPLSDAASPTYGRDTRGATATVLSVTKPDYTKVACGTVINQKYSPSMFEDGKREKLLALIKVYFAKGGQEMQINATSTDVLRDAMEHPESYPDLVVRVSGFSALYVTLAREVQMDILSRTQQE